MKTQRVLIGIYGHPENYPPTLNAITCLAQEYALKAVYRAHQPSNWIYPDGVEIIPDGPILSARAQEQLPIWRKIGLFMRFCWVLRRTLRNWKPDVVLLYDSLSVLAYYLTTRFLGFTSLVWYHNHDVCDPVQVRKYSLTWWSLRAEKWIFPKLTVFSLPAQERKAFFPMDQLGGRFFFLPNYPAKNFYQSFYEVKRPTTEIRLLFQGQVGPGHGIEEIIHLMPLKIQGIPLKLVLKGVFREKYDQWLQAQMEEKNLTAAVELHGFTPYAEVPSVGAHCHIGLAVFTKIDVMNQSLGTASNKIYEYAALGLPILYYDSPHFQQHLSQYKWAIATDLSPKSLIHSLEKILDHYSSLSKAAHQDFLEKLNFEQSFSLVQAYFSSKLGSNLNN